MGEGSGITVEDEPAAQRFVVRVDGAEAGATYYRRVGDRVVFTHTEVDDAYGGRGIGSALARGALDAVRAHGERVVPLCPFIAAYIDRHPDVADLIDEALTAQLRAGG